MRQARGFFTKPKTPRVESNLPLIKKKASMRQCVNGFQTNFRRGRKNSKFFYTQLSLDATVFPLNVFARLYKITPMGSHPTIFHLVPR